MKQAISLAIKIRDQYETFPYPSWVYATPQSHKRSISQYLKDMKLIWKLLSLF